MPTDFSRTLTFQSNDLDKDATLMLMFGSDKVSGTFPDVFPVCWRIPTFGKKGPYRDTLTYTDKLFFVKPEMSYAEDKIVDAYTFVHLNYGQETTLKKDDHGIYEFTGPVKGPGGYLTAINGNSLREDMSIGFNEPTSSKPDTPTSIFYFTHVGSGDSIKAQFTPVLCGYITTEYEAGDIVREIDPSCKVWESDLTNLASETTWNLTYDEASGKYTITQAHEGMDSDLACS